MDRLIGLVLLRWRMDLRGLRRTPERLAGLVLLVPVLGLSAAFAAAVVYVGARTLGARDPDLVLPLASLLATLVASWNSSAVLGSPYTTARFSIFWAGT